MKIICISLLLVLSFNIHASLGLDVTFDISTNMPGVEFSGHSLEKVLVKANVKDQFVKNVLLVIRPSLLTTDINKRDEHMREMIFMNKNLTFKSSGCVIKKKKCTMLGELAIGDTKKEISLPITFETSNVMSFIYSLSLKKQGIKAPSFLGVEVEDIITIKGKISAL